MAFLPPGAPELETYIYLQLGWGCNPVLRFWVGSRFTAPYRKLENQVGKQSEGYDASKVRVWLAEVGERVGPLSTQERIQGTYRQQVDYSSHSTGGYYHVCI